MLWGDLRESIRYASASHFEPVTSRITTGDSAAELRPPQNILTKVEEAAGFEPANHYWPPSFEDGAINRTLPHFPIGASPFGADCETRTRLVCLEGRCPAYGPNPRCTA